MRGDSGEAATFASAAGSSAPLLSVPELSRRSAPTVCQDWVTRAVASVPVKQEAKTAAVAAAVSAPAVTRSTVGRRAAPAADR